MSRSVPQSNTLRIVLASTSAFSVISAVPLLAERLGVLFLPDPEVYSRFEPVMIMLAAVMAISVGVLLFKTPSRNLFGRTLRGVAPIIYAFIFYIGLSTAVPMVWTTLTGHGAVMVVTIAQPVGQATSRCRPAVQLADMPLLFDRLCNIPHGLMMTLVPGDKVMLLGKRSRLGMYYTTARLLPKGQEI